MRTLLYVINKSIIPDVIIESFRFIFASRNRISNFRSLPEFQTQNSVFTVNEFVLLKSADLRDLSVPRLYGLKQFFFFRKRINLLGGLRFESSSLRDCINKYRLFGDNRAVRADRTDENSRTKDRQVDR